MDLSRGTLTLDAGTTFSSTGTFRVSGTGPLQVLTAVTPTDLLVFRG